ncbi:vicilin-like seed storage protein At2g18540 [Drosophila subpulchrella]|uniref:vicilin-like seed storage protein At2g18540 n=1 Tax=Drosophila subpulchrella TaxID=1486046 RepID=UPI0018A1AF43|nr:vicilin-like seed storage protein At2g18540 [Drosophila subpulchrella]
MDPMNSTFDKQEFDWDAINVGDYQLDHSQNFFAAANKENHRRLSNVNVNYLLSCPTPQKICREQFASVPEEPQKSPKSEPQEPKTEITADHSQEQQSNDLSSCPSESKEKLEIEAQEPSTEIPVDHAQDNTLEQPEVVPISPKEEAKSPKEPKAMQEPEVPIDQAQEQQSDHKQIITLKWGEDEEEEEEEQHMTEADQHLVHQGARPPGVSANLRLQWSPNIKHEHHEEAGTSVAPKAYQFKDVYESKRLAAMRRRSEEDKKARQFHSRPMPNFRAMHKRMEELVVVHRITVPLTPEVVKPWQGRVPENVDQERQRPAVTRSKPFNLRSEQRVRDRREFDAAVQVGQEQKKKEQDEQRKRCEQEEIKEIRKMTVFKARPNPFK